MPALTLSAHRSSPLAKVDDAIMQKFQNNSTGLKTVDKEE